MTKFIIPDTETFNDLWLNKLTEQQRKRRLEQAYFVLRCLSKKQIDLLNKTGKEIKTESYRFLYYSKTYQSIWDNADFALHLGKGKYRQYSFYAIRNIFENTFRLEYFSHKKENIQEDIAIRELLRICKRNYEHEKNRKEIKEAEIFKTHYIKIAGKKYPEIDKIKEKDLNPFPDMKTLTNKTEIEGGWYFFYQALAELTHGKFMHLVITETDHNAEHRRSLSIALPLCNYLLSNCDYHLNHQTKNEVIECVKKAEYMIKHSK